MFLTTPTNQPKQITKGGAEGREAENEKELKIDMPNCHPLWSCKCAAPCPGVDGRLACFLRLWRGGQRIRPALQLFLNKYSQMDQEDGPFSVDSLPFAVSIGLVLLAGLQICRHLWPAACCCTCSFLFLCCCQPASRLCQDLRCSLSSLSRGGNPLVAARRKLFKTYSKTFPTPAFIFMWLGHPHHLCCCPCLLLQLLSDPTQRICFSTSFCCGFCG